MLIINKGKKYLQLYFNSDSTQVKDSKGNLLGYIPDSKFYDLLMKYFRRKEK